MLINCHYLNTTCILFHNSIRPQIQRFELIYSEHDHYLGSWKNSQIEIFAQKHNAKYLSHVFPGAVFIYIFKPGCWSETRRSILARPSLSLLHMKRKQMSRYFFKGTTRERERVREKERELLNCVSICTTLVGNL